MLGGRHGVKLLRVLEVRGVCGGDRSRGSERCGCELDGGRASLWEDIAHTPDEKG